MMRHWSLFFLISLGLSFVNIVTLLSVFKLKRQEGMYRTRFTFVSFVDWKDIDILAEEGQGHASELAAGSTGRNKYRQILGIKTVHALALFVLFYVGTEV